MTDVRRIASDDWRQWRGLRLKALSEAPDAFSTSLTDWQGEGDREERWRARLEDVALNLVAYADDEQAGMVRGAVSDDQLELISMWVAPFATGRGIGDALVDALIGYAESIHSSSVLLSVMVGNDHAIRMYRRHGFVDVGEDTRDGATGSAERRLMRRHDAGCRAPGA